MCCRLKEDDNKKPSLGANSKSTNKPSTQLAARSIRTFRVYKKITNILQRSFKSHSVQVLSLHNNQLLVGKRDRADLDIYATNGTLIKTVSRAPSVNLLFAGCVDAAWTQQHLILCATPAGIEIIDSSSNTILRSHPADIKISYSIGVSPDASIYLGTLNEGIWKTVNDGATWSPVKQLPYSNDEPGRLEIICTIAVPFDDSFWTIETDAAGDRLRVYIYQNSSTAMPRVIYEHFNGGLINNVIKKLFFRLVCIEQLGAVLMTDQLNQAVHVFSADGAYEGKLVFDNPISDGPCSVAVDNLTLYLGMDDGRIQIHNIARLRT